MPILIFAPVPLDGAKQSRTMLEVSTYAHSRLMEELGGGRSTYTTDHVGLILELADSSSADTDLRQLAEAILQSGIAYVRFL